MKNFIRTILISLLLLIVYNSKLLAVDEDYFIPYTDNYGYEYDPETGTYIKKEPDPMSTPNHPQSASTDTTGTSAAQIESPPVPASADNSGDDSNLGLPLIIAGAFILLGGIMVFVRRQGNSN